MKNWEDITESERKDYEDTRRLRIYWLSQDWFTGLLDGFVKLVGDGCVLPDDARVRSAHSDWDRGGISVMVHSLSFDVVPDGAEPPRAETVYVEPMTRAEAIARENDEVFLVTVDKPSWRDNPML